MFSRMAGKKKRGIVDSHIEFSHCRCRSGRRHRRCQKFPAEVATFLCLLLLSHHFGWQWDITVFVAVPYALALIYYIKFSVHHFQLVILLCASVCANVDKMMTNSYSVKG